MKRKLLVISLVLLLVMSIGSVVQAEYQEMSKEKMMKMFTEVEIQAWKVSQKFISERENLKNYDDPSFMILEYLRPHKKAPKDYIKKLDENIYKVNVQFKYQCNGDEVEGGYGNLVLKKKGKVEWELLEYEGFSGF